MPSSTPIYGLRYPVATDPVPVLPTDIQNLAEDIENVFDDVVSYMRIIPTGSHTNINFTPQGVGIPVTGTQFFTVNNVFTTEYDSYLITWIGGRQTTAGAGFVEYPGITTGYRIGRLGGVPDNTTMYGFASVLNNPALYLNANTSSRMTLEIFGAALSGSATTIKSFHQPTDNVIGANFRLRQYGFNGSTNAISSFTIRWNSNLIADGAVNIYGMNL